LGDFQKELDFPTGAGAQGPAAPAATGTHKPVEAPKDGDLRQEISDWVEQELAPAFRTPSPAVNAAARRASALKHRQERTVTTDWPRHVRSETYMQNRLRIWGTRVSWVVGALVAGNVAIAVGSLVLSSLSLPVLPDLPAAPAKELPAVVAAAPVSSGDGVVVPDTSDDSITQSY
jgi:hypothetical protein